MLVAMATLAWEDIEGRAAALQALDIGAITSLQELEAVRDELAWIRAWLRATETMLVRRGALPDSGPPRRPAC